MDQQFVKKMSRPKGDQETYFEVIDLDLVSEKDCTQRDKKGRSLHAYETLEEAVAAWSDLNLKAPAFLHKVVEHLPNGEKREVETPDLSEALIRVRDQRLSGS